VDILVELDKRFENLITSRLDERSKNAILKQEDPATMSDIEKVKIRKSILQRVYGKSGWHTASTSASISCTQQCCGTVIIFYGSGSGSNF
jgi:hypothetical protein